MYNVHNNLLGEVPTPAAPSLWDSFSKLLSSGVQAGFNIYNRTQQIKQTQQQTAALQALAQQSTMAYTAPMTGVTPGMVSYNPYGGSNIFDGWTIPIIVAGGGLVLFLALRK